MINILMVDDDAGDTLMAREAIEESGLLTSFYIAHDGLEAMAFLQNDAPHENAPRPDLILLDLNMPRMNGHELLNWLKAHPDYKKIPVVILTTSSSMHDIEECYANNANCFITKPVDLDQFTKTIQQTSCFWSETAKLPGRM